MKNPRYVNDSGGLVIDYDQPVGGSSSIYVDSGPLLERAMKGEFGAISPYVPPDNTEEIEQGYVDAVHLMLNRHSRELGYIDIQSACSFAGYSNAFQADALALGVWRAEVWEYFYSLNPQQFESASDLVSDILQNHPAPQSSAMASKRATRKAKIVKIKT